MGHFIALFKYFAFVLAVFAPELLWACPLCHTTTAEEVRQNLWITAQDPSVLAGVSLPFLLMAFFYKLVNRNSDSNLALATDSQIKRRKQDGQ